MPQPRRMVGILLCAYCWEHFWILEWDPKLDWNDRPHPGWTFRLIAQPRKQGIFLTLRACSESRKVWLSRLGALPRRIPISRGQYVLNDVQYVNYDIHFLLIFLGLESAPSGYARRHLPINLGLSTLRTRSPLLYPFPPITQWSHSPPFPNTQSSIQSCDARSGD